MKVTIGILAHNESAVIARTVASLFEQSVFNGQDLGADWQILVVPNGCKDDTHRLAEQALQAACASRQAVRWQVESLERPGKSHAWNRLVHEIASADTDVFVMIDADIEFGHVDTIANCVRRLSSDSHAWTVVDLPLKDFHRKPRHTLLEKASLRASKARVDDDELAGIAGSFYVMSGQRMRSIWMPLDLSVEDGFLYSMVITDNFRQEPDPTRVVRAADASHYYEGLTRVRDIVNHEVRLMVGTVLNTYLCWDVLLFMTPRRGPGAGEIVRVLNEQDPSWYPRMMANQIHIRGGRAVGMRLLWQRLAAWRALPWAQRLARLPIALAMSAFDALVLWRANRKLVSGRAIALW